MPASILSDITVCSNPNNLSTPITSIVFFCTLFILAPILFKASIKSSISGSIAAFESTVFPKAIDAAIIIFSVAPTLDFNKLISEPINLPLGTIPLI